MIEPIVAAGCVTPPAGLAAEAAPWVEALRAAAGPSFRALYMHGSALSARFDPRTSDVNLLLVVDALPFALLDEVARTVARLGGGTGRRFVPVVITTAQAGGSADVFPGDFIDLARRRALLAGDDVLSSVIVSLHNLRHQCEYELRAKVVGLRQAYVLTGGPPGMAARVLARSAGGLAAVLRMLLVLHGQTPPDDAAGLTAAVAQRFGVDAEALGAPFAARKLGTLPEAQARDLLARHLTALESLTGAVDAFPIT